MTQKFGQYLQSVRERDIDLILLEEFHCCEEFVEWFCKTADFENVQFVGAWNSVSNVYGETDLLVCVQQQHKIIGLFVENKIKALEQDNQDGRYHIRAQRAVADGTIDEYHTMIIAPDQYLRNFRTDHAFMSVLSFEKIESWFEGRKDPRSKWRSAIMREAIEQNRRPNNMIKNSTRSQFFEDYWRYLKMNHPSFIMNRPTAKGNKSRWVMFKGLEFGPGIQFTHKCNKCLIELGFSRTSLNNFPASILDNLPSGARATQVGGKTAIHFDVPEIDLESPLDTQVESVEAAISAAYLLMPVFEDWKNKV